MREDFILAIRPWPYDEIDSQVGVFWGAFTERESQHNQENLKELLTWLAEGSLKPHISATYPLEQAADALYDMMKRRVLGKVVLVP